MTQINTTYENLGPVVKAVSSLRMNDFFQLPDDASVYRLIHQQADICFALCLDDLTVITLKAGAAVEPREVNLIDVKVELL